MNGLAVASLVLGIVGWTVCIGSILAVVFGFVARTQIQDSRGAQSGEGMAKAGIILGFVGIALVITLVVVSVLTNGNNGSS